MAEAAHIDAPAIQAPASRAAYTGILPSQDIKKMVRSRDIQFSHDLEDDQIQPASIDLRLGQFAYRVDTSFLPGAGVKVTDKLAHIDERFQSFKIDLRGGAVLEKDCVYVIPLQEAISLKSEIAAFANPKSSTGRLDILTRLIADGATRFDQVEEGYEGQLYVEVVPRSFSIIAKTGTRLNQLRFRRTRGEAPKPISASDWRQLLEDGQIVDKDHIQKKTDAKENRGELPFTVDLKGRGCENALIGWSAKKHTRPLDLGRRDYDPLDYWEPIRFHKESSIVLAPDKFYILMTEEAIAVPPDYAAEMLPYDTRAGEFRVHYAGFFDPGFGWNSKTGAGGSRGVLEVRSHEVPFLLEHGQTVGWLRYERMAARPDVLYGQDMKSNYQGQSLKLAKQFAPFQE